MISPILAKPKKILGTQNEMNIMRFFVFVAKCQQNSGRRLCIFLTRINCFIHVQSHSITFNHFTHNTQQTIATSEKAFKVYIKGTRIQVYTEGIKDENFGLTIIIIIIIAHFLCYI